MTNEKYNGWTNRETWLVNLYFDTAISEMIEEAVSSRDVDIEGQTFTVKGEISSLIQSFVEETFEEEIEGLSSFLKDFIDLGKIDYYDLADSIYRELA